MSDYYHSIVDTEVSLEEAPQVARRVVDELIRRGIVLSTPQMHELLGEGPPYAAGPSARKVATYHREIYPSGLKVVVERRVYSTLGNGTDSLTCPLCGHTHEANVIDWVPTVHAWCDHQDLASLLCTECEKASPITVWRFEPEWGFGNLAFEFANWTLKPRFVKEMAGLIGHRIAAVQSRL